MIQNDSNDPLLYEITVPFGNLTLLFYFNEKICTDNSKPSMPHDHPDYEIHYMVQGVCRHFIGQNVYDACIGDVLILHPNQYHYQEQSTPRRGHGVFYSLQVAIKPPLETASPATLKAYAALRAVLDECELLHDTKRILMPFFQLIHEEINNRRNGYYVNLQSACAFMMISLIRLSDYADKKSLFPDEKLKHIPDWRHQIENFLFKHFGEDLRLQDLAEAIGLSTRQTSRLILREYGMNFVTKLNDVRIQHAAYLLRQGTQNIHEVSVSCGFPNYGYFSTCFRQKIGVTPSQYHKQFAKQGATDEKIIE